MYPQTPAELERTEDMANQLIRDKRALIIHVDVRATQPREAFHHFISHCFGEQVPRQPNTYDCGPFAIHTARFILQQPINFLTQLAVRLPLTLGVR